MAGAPSDTRGRNSVGRSAECGAVVRTAPPAEMLEHDDPPVGLFSDYLPDVSWTSYLYPARELAGVRRSFTFR